jgi:hypothetical protein
MPDAESRPDPPASIYVPTQPLPESGWPAPERVVFDLRTMADGRAGLAVYTDHERLVAELGAYQSCVLVPVLDLLVRLSGSGVPVMVNPTLADGARRWTADEVRAWRARDGA